MAADSRINVEGDRTGNEPKKHGQAKLRPPDVRLSLHSSKTTFPKFSFGGAGCRFLRSREEMNDSSSCLSPRTTATICPDEFVSTSLSFRSADTNTSSCWGEFDHTGSLCSSKKAPRFEGSTDRFMEPRQRNKSPLPKSYPPAETIGQMTAPTYQHAPQYSFGGGKLARPPGGEKAQIHTRLTEAQKKKARSAPCLRPAKEHKRLCRGFGTDARFRFRGGYMELPISPGPAAYEVPRDSDPVPEWGSTSLFPWGTRTSQRKLLRNPTSTDTGPGEELVAFKPSTTSPAFGYRVIEVKSKNIAPPPDTYDLPSTFTGPSFSTGPGKRSGFQIVEGPGPGAHSPSMIGVDRDISGVPFGRCTSERRHPGDGVDPDDPPGPGTHQVRKDPRPSDKPSVGMPQAPRGHIGGMGPRGLPGPGHYKLPQDTGKKIGIHLPCALPIKPTPGPGDYNDSKELCKVRAPVYGPLNFTDPRKSPFVKESCGTQMASEAVLRECATELARTAESLGYQAKQREAKYESSTPSYSLGARQPLLGPRLNMGKLGPPVTSIG